MLLAGCAGERRAPNVLFILADELRWDALGCYGNTDVRTPSLDRLAAQGARLDRFYVAAPLCSPSRASFLSGLYPRQSGVMDNRERAEFPRPVETVATHLERAGYRTAFVGKAHMGGDPTRWGFRDVPLLLPSGGAHIERSVLVADGEERSFTGPPTRHFVDAAIRYVTEHRDDRWFLWLSTRAAHRPYVEPPAAAPPRPTGPPPGWPDSQPLSDHDWAGYYVTVELLDREVGRLLAALEEAGLARDTLVFFAGDNGSMFGSHDEERKQVWYEECARTPALARWPGEIPAGLVTTAPAVSVDFLPTLLDLCGLPPLSGLEGATLLPALRGGAGLRTHAFSELERSPRFGGGRWEMVRGERYKYVRFEDGRAMLYDLVEDPHELEDRSGSEAHAGVRNALARRLDRWARELES